MSAMAVAILAWTGIALPKTDSLRQRRPRVPRERNGRRPSVANRTAIRRGLRRAAGTCRASTRCRRPARHARWGSELRWKWGGRSSTSPSPQNEMLGHPSHRGFLRVLAGLNTRKKRDPGLIKSRGLITFTLQHGTSTFVDFRLSCMSRSYQTLFIQRGPSGWFRHLRSYHHWQWSWWLRSSYSCDSTWSERGLCRGRKAWRRVSEHRLYPHQSAADERAPRH